MKSIVIIDRGRGPELAGTRITIYTILPYLELGWPPTRIAQVHHISEEQVRALMEYFEQHKEVILAENAKILERIARGNPPEVEARRLASRAKLEAFREELVRKRQLEANGEGHRG
jgi:uncharacterized protein (DUF433 family)